MVGKIVCRCKKLVVFMIIVTMVTPSVVLGVDSSQTWNSSPWDNLSEIEPFGIKHNYGSDIAYSWENWIFYEVSHIADYDEADPAKIKQILDEQSNAWRQDPHVQATLRIHELINGTVSFSSLTEEYQQLILQQLDIAEGAFVVATELFLMMERNGHSLAKSVDLMVIMSGGLFNYTEAQTLIANIPNTIERNTEIMRFERFVLHFDIPSEIRARKLISRSTGDETGRVFADISSFAAHSSFDLQYSFIEAARFEEFELPELEYEYFEYPVWELPEDEEYTREDDEFYEDEDKQLPEDEKELSTCEAEYLPLLDDYPAEHDEVVLDFARPLYPIDALIPIFNEHSTEYEQDTLQEGSLTVQQPARAAYPDSTRIGLDNARRTRPWANRNRENDAPEYLAVRNAISAAFTNENAFNTARQMFLDNRGATEIETVFAIGAALQVEPQTFMLPPDVYRTESAMLFINVFDASAPGSDDFEPTPQPPTPLRAVQYFTPVIEHPFDSDLVMHTINVDEEELNDIIEYGMEIVGLGMIILRPPVPIPFTHDHIINNPFGSRFNVNESVNLNTGAATYRTNVMSLPGRGGFGLSLDLVYNSADADLSTPGRSEFAEWFRLCLFLRQDLPLRAFELWWLWPDGTVTFIFACYWCRDDRCFQLHSPFIEENLMLLFHNRNEQRQPSNGLGVGWRFDLPHVRDNVLHISGRGSFALYQNQIDRTLHTLQDIQQAHDTSFTSGTHISANRITFYDGTSYFFMNDWHIIGKQDRFGNTIRFQYIWRNGQWVLSVITDSNNKQINFQYQDTGTNRTITITGPDNSSYVINLSRIQNAAGHINPQNLFQLNNIQNQVGAVTSFAYDTSNFYFNFGTFGPIGAFTLRNQTLLLRRVNYPSGAQLRFNYGWRDTSLGSYGFRNTFIVTSRYLFNNNRSYNQTSFSYQGIPTPFRLAVTRPPTHSHHTYGITVTQNNGLRTVYTFNYRHLNTQQRTYNSVNTLLSQQTIVYNNDRLPTSVTLTEHCGGFSRTNTQRFYYNQFGQVTTAVSPLAQGSTHARYRTITTYDSRFGLPLTTTFMPDSNTTIQEINLLSGDGRSIISSMIYENNVRMSRTNFLHDTHGNITEIREFPNTVGADFIATQVTYDRGTMPTSIRTTGVRDTNGVLLGGTGIVERHFTYDSMWRLLSETDPMGYVTSWQYDRIGRIIRVTHPNGGFETYTYDDQNNILSHRTIFDASYTHRFDGLGNLLTITDPSGTVILRNIYDNRMRVTETKNAQGIASSQRTTFIYDIFDRATDIRRLNAVGGIMYRETTVFYNVHDGVGNSRIETTIHGTTEVAPNIVTFVQRDRFGRVTQEGTVGGIVVTYTHDLAGRVVAEQSLGVHNTFTYNIFGVASVRNIEGNTRHNTYDSMGRLLTSSDFMGNIQRFTYDALGRLVIHDVPFEREGNVTRYSRIVYFYDRNNNLIQTSVRINLPGQPVQYSDTVNTFRYNRLMSSHTGNGPLTEYTYDLVGNVLTKRVGGATGGATTTFAYNNRGQLIRTTDALGQSETFTYDANGLLLTRTDRNGTVFRMTYDSMGRLIREETVQNGVVTGHRAFTFTATGATGLVTSDDHFVFYYYDAQGRVIRQTETGGIVKTFAYNAANNIIDERVYINGARHYHNMYTFDTAQRVQTVRANGTLLTTYTYNVNGQRTRTTHYNGTVAEYTRNLAGLVTRLVNRQGTTVLSQFDNTYYLDGNIHQVIEVMSGVTRTITYTYDTARRLIREHDTGTGGGAITREYTFDNRSNRTQMVVTGMENYTVTYTHDLNNRLLTETRTGSNPLTATFTYDRNGNQLTRVAEVENVITSPQLQVWSHAELVEAVQYVAEQGYTEQVIIWMMQDFSVMETISANVIEIPAGVNILLASYRGNVFTYHQMGHLQNHFHVKGILTLQNVILCGVMTDTSNRGGIRVFPYGHLIMEEGSAVVNIRSNSVIGNSGAISVDSNGTFTMRDGIIEGNIQSPNASLGGGGGVNVRGGTFIMEGGAIRNNTVPGSIAQARGGGVYIFSDGIFIMESGIIEGNTALAGGGVNIVAGTFTMNGGIIRGNTATGTSGNNLGGGGVHLSRINSVFNMNGGTIGGPNPGDANTATGGGGVRVVDGIFTMSGGVIEGNESSRSGGGVCINGARSTFIIEDGVIRNNSTTGVISNLNRGGGVSVRTNSIFIMYNGVIEGNTAAAGGGIAIYNVSFTMNGGVIRGNHAINTATSTIVNQGGGGVYLERGIFEMNGGIIGGPNPSDANIASRGGGISVQRGTLYMMDSTIQGNKADNGGGIWVATNSLGADVVMNSGHIIGNSAAVNGGGIFTARSGNNRSPVTLISYVNLFINPVTQFSGNTAGNGAFNPPSNALQVMPLASAISISSHQLNNYDINYVYEPHRINTSQAIVAMQGMARHNISNGRYVPEPLPLDTHTAVEDDIIRIYVLINGEFVPLASQVVEGVSAVDQRGSCAKGFIRMSDVIEVSKKVTWQTIVLTVTANGHGVNVALANPWYDADLCESVEMYKAKESETLEINCFAATGFEPMAMVVASGTTITLTEIRAYNAFNQLVRFENDDTIATYTYRTDGLRHSKVVSGVMTTHVWNRGHVVLERNATGGVVQRYYRSLNGRLIRSYHHGFYLYNVRGDVKQRTCDQGVIIAIYRYSAFGVELNPAVGNTNRFRFAGEYWDTHRGEYYLRARSFNPRLGRFTQPDPFWGIHNMQNCIHSILQAGNLFVYCGNDPVNRIDPSGLAYFIFHCSDFRSQAAWQARQLVGIIHIHHITYVGDFITKWNNMAALDMIFGVFIFTHGHGRAISFANTFDAISVDGYTRASATASAEAILRSLAELNPIQLYRGHVHLFACNPGHMATYHAMEDGNFASALSSIVSGGGVFAFDGGVAFGVSGGFWGNARTMLTRNFVPRVSNRQGGFRYILEHHGHERYSREPYGRLFFRDGQLATPPRSNPCFCSR